jgi:hypothetical protein
MRIEREHGLGVDAARQRIDGLASELLARPLPAGVKIEDSYKAWTGDRMDFSLKVSKGFFGARIGGAIDVAPDRVIFDCQIPPMVAGFIGEDRIRTAIEQQLDAVLVRG